MSLRKKKKEIQRLIIAFEDESNKFHDITFSKFLIKPDGPADNRKFSSPNHTIMLWQYFGKMSKKGGPAGLVKDLMDSNLQWGLRGADFSLYGIIEGEKCGLFVRMAKRAGNLFNEKESNLIKLGIESDLEKTNEDEASTTVIATNNDTLAIWLNYLLYYISKVNPGRERLTKIEPDPFTLSLLALEDLIEYPQIKKVDKSLNKIEDIYFKVALSFPGEKRSYVSEVANQLREELGKDKVFYDLDYQSQLAKPNLDTVLQNIYHHKSELIVVFLCEEYSQKEWCGLELRAIRDLIKSKENVKIMFVRFDDAKIDGVFSIDGYIDANNHSELEISRFIIERLMLLDH